MDTEKLFKRVSDWDIKKYIDDPQYFMMREGRLIGNGWIHYCIQWTMGDGLTFCEPGDITIGEHVFIGETSLADYEDWEVSEKFREMCRVIAVKLNWEIQQREEMYEKDIEELLSGKFDEESEE